MGGKVGVAGQGGRKVGGAEQGWKKVGGAEQGGREGRCGLCVECWLN